MNTTQPTTEHIIGELSPFDQVLNGLLGMGEPRMCAKVTVLAAIQDLDPKTQKRILPPRFDKQSEQLSEIVCSALTINRAVTERTLRRWTQEVRTNIERNRNTLDCSRFRYGVI